MGCIQYKQIGHYAILHPSHLRTEGSMSLEAITKEIRAEIAKLSQVLHLLEGGAKSKISGHGVMSAAGRKRIAAAQRARWAKVRAAKK
jgi:hypothetical protein